ncbi:MAG: TolC family protein [Phycisphaerae bacterium]
MARFLRGAAPLATLLLAVGGCQKWFLDQADREVYQLIESRQQAALGETHSAELDAETGQTPTSPDLYSFAPHPVDADVPPAFRSATSAQSSRDTPAQATEGLTMPGAEMGRPELRFTLSDALAYALRRSREYQTAKEDLYLLALALSLERFLWTPQFSSDLSFEFADFGQVRDFDRAMTATATLAAEQRLPLGGTITAQVIDSWMRDLKVHTTSGETGQIILSADIPLLRGAGRVAYESRYQAERNLIYAVRTFERFRRTFLVEIASDFFNLQALYARVTSAQAQAASLVADFDRAKELAAKERTLQLEADRARVDLLNARNRVASAQEIYGTALDNFKIRLNIRPETAVELIDEPIELFYPDATEQQAIQTALKYRLDLFNSLDAVDDARRAVRIAQNNLLPDFNFTGSVAMNTDPGKPSTVHYNTENTTWRGRFDFEVPLNRQAERNDYRSAWIDLRRAERAYDQFRDGVQAEVRRAMRQIVLARISMEIQKESITINEFRRAQARALFDIGQVSSNRDVIEAENNLRQAKNEMARAEADFRRTILEFLLSTGTLRVGDDGKWLSFDNQPAEAPADQDG